MSDARQVSRILRAAATAAEDDTQERSERPPSERVDAGARGLPPHLRPLGPVPEIPGELML